MICGRNREKLEETVRELKASGECEYVVADVSNESDCKILMEETVKRFGRIDVLINNAGISMRALFSDVDLKVIREVMNTNFWGTVYCTKYALPYLLQSMGSVVGISSIAGKKGLPARTGYSASKFAMEGFLEALRIENMKKGLHVLIAHPGFTATDIRNRSLSNDGSKQGESPRDEKAMMSADNVAEKIYSAVQKRGRSFVLTAEGKMAVWLNKFFPALADKLVYKHFAKEKDSPLK